MTLAAPQPMEILAEGRAPYHPVDPDGFREWVRDHKSRAMVSKLMSEKEAVERFVADGDYLTYECNYLTRGPNLVLNEIMRQGRKNLWIAGKFTYVDVGLLVGAGCVSKVDTGFFLATPGVKKALAEGTLEALRVQQRGDVDAPRSRGAGHPLHPHPFVRRHRRL